MKRRSAKQAKRDAQRRKSKGRIPALVLCVTVTLAALGAWMVIKRPRTESDQAERYLPRPRGQLSFNKDIAPIIHRHCAGCHRPGEAGPFNLVSYQDAKGRAADLVTVTERRYMPPWLPEHGPPALAGERRLTADEIGVIRQWAAEGAPEGSPGDKPTPPTWPEGWQLGTPDLIAEMPEAYTLSAEGRDVYRNFVIPLSVTARQFVRAYEFKANNSKVLHHIFMRFDRSRQSRRLDAQDAEPGFGGMSAPASAESPGGFFLSWQPGRGPTRSPDGLAWPLEPGSDLILQAHMQPSGKPELVRPRIGFYFTSEAPTNTPFKISLSSVQINIPAGARNYAIQDSYVLPVDVQLLAVLPHAHYLGKQLQGYAVLPNGERRQLLNIKAWDFNWQSDYRYLEPINLPKGTRLGMRYTYDNSSQNVRNPHQPPVRVAYGLRSEDEMGELWLQMLPRDDGERQTLAADYGRRQVQKILEINAALLQQNPADAHAHIQFGKALDATGRSGEALDHFRRAVQLNPNLEEGQYQLGMKLMYSDPARAESAFAETIRINPENFKAHNNLGMILMSFNRLAEAEAHFQSALKLSPNDPIILQNMDLLRLRRSRP